MPRINPNRIGGANVAAFLDMVAFSEIGPALMRKSDDGYNVIVGSTANQPTLFPTYAAHPKVKVWIESIKNYSSAAGRYQLLGRYYDPYKNQLKLPDFSPESQDLIAVQQIKERKAFEDIKAGRFDIAVEKCNSIWASLHGAGYGQHENSLEVLVLYYRRNGGFIA